MHHRAGTIGHRHRAGGGSKRALREPIICEWCGELEPPTHPKQCKLRAFAPMKPFPVAVPKGVDTVVYEQQQRQQQQQQQSFYEKTVSR